MLFIYVDWYVNGFSCTNGLDSVMKEKYLTRKEMDIKMKMKMENDMVSKRMET